MARYRWAILVAAVIWAGGSSAEAQNRSISTGLNAATPAPVPAKRSSHRKRPMPTASEHESLRQFSRDFYSGSASQQNLERNDNEAARMKPIDHHKDDFFSDWKGLQ